MAYMPFGLHNATQTFQCFIHEALCSLDFVFAHIADLIVSSFAVEHLCHLELRLRPLTKYGVGIQSS